MRTLNQLFKTPRLYYKPLDSNNTVEGLFDMVKEIMLPSFVVVEIGSFSGVSSELFAKFCKTLYCVDVWNTDPGYTEIDSEKINQSLLHFNKMKLGYSNINQIKMSSLEAVKQFPDNSIEMVYIDGAHDYKNVIADIKAWLPKVKDYGFVTGHDIDLKYAEKEGMRVYEAVTEMFGSNYKTYKDTSWAHQVIRL